MWVSEECVVVPKARAAVPEAQDGGVRMSPHRLSQESVLAAIASDPRFANSAERCAFLAEIRASEGGLTEADLRAGGCE